MIASQNCTSNAVSNEPSITSKKCTRCNKMFDMGSFKFDAKKLTYAKQCMACQAKQLANVMKHYNANKDKDHYKSKLKQYKKTYRAGDAFQKNKEERKNDPEVQAHKREYNRNWNLNNPEKYRESQKACYKRFYEKNKDSEEYKAKKKAYATSPEAKTKRNERQRIRRKEDPLYALRDNLSNRIRRALRSHGATKTNKTIEYLGCSISVFRKHLESQFQEGMSWRNYGRKKKDDTDEEEKYWEIDHINPIKYKNPSEEEIKGRLHYTNCQPMWADENRAKSNRFIGRFWEETLDGIL